MNSEAIQKIICEQVLPSYNNSGFFPKAYSVVGQECYVLSEENENEMHRQIKIFWLIPGSNTYQVFSENDQTPFYNCPDEFLKKSTVNTPSSIKWRARNANPKLRTIQSQEVVYLDYPKFLATDEPTLPTPLSKLFPLGNIECPIRAGQLVRLRDGEIWTVDRACFSSNEFFPLDLKLTKDGEVIQRLYTLAGSCDFEDDHGDDIVRLVHVDESGVVFESWIGRQSIGKPDSRHGISSEYPKRLKD